MVLSLYICGELLHQSQETNTQPKLMGASGLSRCMCIPSGLAELEVASSFLSSDLSTSSGLAFSERPSSTPQPLLYFLNGQVDSLPLSHLVSGLL